MSKKSKHNYKGIFFDVDGTLITNKFNAKLSPKVKHNLLKTKQKMSVGIATGRPLERVTFIFDELGLRKPCIVNGGAQIVNPATREILWERPILQKDIRNITTVLKKLPNKVWVVENGKEKLYKKHETTHFQKPLSFFIPRIEETKANNVIKKLTQNRTIAVTKVVAYHTGCVALHITHAHATKKHAILKAAEMLKTNSKDLIGVGDGYNDLAMFLATGFHVAVDNAVPELKTRAQYIAPDVAQDGVAHFLDKFVF